MFRNILILICLYVPDQGVAIRPEFCIGEMRGFAGVERAPVALRDAINGSHPGARRLEQFAQRRHDTSNMTLRADT